MTAIISFCHVSNSINRRYKTWWSTCLTITPSTTLRLFDSWSLGLLVSWTLGPSSTNIVDDQNKLERLLAELSRWKIDNRQVNESTRPWVQLPSIREPKQQEKEIKSAIEQDCLTDSRHRLSATNSIEWNRIIDKNDRRRKTTTSSRRLDNKLLIKSFHSQIVSIWLCYKYIFDFSTCTEKRVCLDDGLVPRSWYLVDGH